MQQGSPSVPEITSSQLKEAMDADQDLVLVDVREYFEKAISDLPEVGQVRIPMSEIPHRMHQIPRDARVVVYCRSGSRSGAVTKYLLSQGWGEVLNLKGGILGWREEVDPDIAAY